MKPSSLLAVSMCFLSLGCAVKPKDIRELYERQARLEAEIEKISQNVEALRKDTDERISRIEENVNRDYLELKTKMDVLEKKVGRETIPSPQSSDDLYSLAESYYRRGKFEEAILAFQRFIATYPKDRRVPLSYLRQGLSLINIGKKKEARFFLQTLISKFPNSEEAKTAEEKLREIEGKDL